MLSALLPMATEPPQLPRTKCLCNDGRGSHQLRGRLHGWTTRAANLPSLLQRSRMCLGVMSARLGRHFFRVAFAVCVLRRRTPKLGPEQPKASPSEIVQIGICTYIFRRVAALILLFSLASVGLGCHRHAHSQPQMTSAHEYASHTYRSRPARLPPPTPDPAIVDFTTESDGRRMACWKRSDGTNYCESLLTYSNRFRQSPKADTSSPRQPKSISPGD